MKRHLAENGVEWLTFELFSEFPDLVHGVFLRHGGISAGELGSLNFGVWQGDSIENVEVNRKRALSALNLTSWVALNQEHGHQIVEATEERFQTGDGLVTNQVDLALFILHADCQSAIFYDPIYKVLANIHCGWRGNVFNIYKKAIEAMQKFGCKPENLLVGISPSLGPHASEFIHFHKEFPTEFLSFQIRPTYFDLWEISRWQLLQAGILPHHIEIAQMCTYQNEKDFFSYRRLKKSGRHATIAALR